MTADTMDSTTAGLKGKTALITGSTSGIGYAMAQGLARAGCDIVLHGIEDAESVRPAQAALEREHGVNASYVRADLSDRAAIVTMLDTVQRGHGAPDVLVNNAVTRHFSPIESFPL